MPHQFKIFAPFNEIEEVLPLIESGADEFYCSVTIDNENLASIRNKEASNKLARASNLSNLKILKKSAFIIRKNNKKIYLALNRPALERKQKDIIKKHAKKIKTSGINGIILADLELMEEFRNSGLEIVASSFFSAQNKEAAELLSKMGATRIIFDRQITLNDLKTVRRFPKIEFEVFILGCACRSLPAYCFFGSNAIRDVARDFRSNQPLRHLCCGNFSVRGRGGDLSPEIKKLIGKRLTMPDAFGAPACGVCALPLFRRHKIHSLKIVGRDRPADVKVRSVAFVKNALNILDCNYPPRKFYAETQALFEKTFGQPCEHRYCYYPHFFH